MVLHSSVISHTLVIALQKCLALIVSRLDENSFLLVIQHKLVNLILCKGTLQFFISREQTCPFSLNDFYFRLMETTKTEKNKYKVPKREHSVCDSRWELAQQQLGLWVYKLALKDTAHRTLFSSNFYCPGIRGLLQGSWEKLPGSFGEWGPRQAWHRAMKTLQVLHWARRILEIPNLFFFPATTTDKEKQK